MGVVVTDDEVEYVYVPGTIMIVVVLFALPVGANRFGIASVVAYAVFVVVDLDLDLAAARGWMPGGEACEAGALDVDVALCLWCLL